MILTFKSEFVEKIKSGQKVTTIRKRGRWKVDDKIHFWKDNPRNVNSNPYSFGIGKVLKVEPIDLLFHKHIEYSAVFKVDTSRRDIYNTYQYFKDKKYFNEIAKKDGFKNFKDMYNWFRSTYKKQIDEDGCLCLTNLDLITFEYLGDGK